MPTWKVRTPLGFEMVTADRSACNNDGSLSFFNRPTDGEKWGDNVARFPAGQWLHHNIVRSE